MLRQNEIFNNVPKDKRLSISNPEIWAALVPGDLIITDSIGNHRDALIVLEVTKTKIIAKRLRNDRNHFVFRNLGEFFWI